MKANFERYGLLDDQVRFLKGWFRETLPKAPIERLAIVRLDGDMYESTLDGLVNLYPKLSVGGYLIVDDYGAVSGCRQAVLDYRERLGITDEIIPTDWTAVYWRRSNETMSLQPPPDQRAGVQPAEAAGRGRQQALELFEEARSLIGIGNLPEAAASFRQALQADAGLAAAHYYLGYIALEQSDKAQAVAEFRRATQLEPDRSDFFNGLGAALQAAGETIAAEGAFRRALELDHRNVDALRNLAELLENAKRYSEALDLHTLLLALDPTNEATLTKMGELSRLSATM